MAELRSGSTVGGKIIETEEGSLKKITQALLELSNAPGGGSVVQPSGINGNIKVNSIEVQVYNDSSMQNLLFGKANIIHSHDISNINNLQNLLDGKASLIHSHMLANILDVDVTNKVDGYVLTYDSATNKFVSKSISISGGSGSVVTGSTNGKIKVDGVDLIVYNDASILASIANKADASHTHTLANISDAGTAASKNVGTAAGNIPILDGAGKLNTSVLPGLALTSTNVVASQTAMLALTAEPGDIAVRTDLSKTFILKTAGASTLANWQELLTPTAGVSSVAGKTGSVTLTASDVGLGNVTNESKSTMFANAVLTGTPTATTTSAANNSTQIATTAFVQTNLSNKASLVHSHTTSDITDLDTTTKANGYVLTYDAATGKFMPKPPQGGSGGGSTVVDSTTNGNIVVDGSEVNVYTHPSNHPAAMITEDSTHRFVTDAEKVLWNNLISTVSSLQSQLSTVQSQLTSALARIDALEGNTGQTIEWQYDFVVPQSIGVYTLTSDGAWNHTLTNEDVYGQALNGVNTKMKLLTLGVQDGVPNEPGQELPKDGFDSFEAPSMHGAYSYDSDTKQIYFQSAAMNPYYFRIIKYV